MQLKPLCTAVLISSLTMASTLVSVADFVVIQNMGFDTLVNVAQAWAGN